MGDPGKAQIRTAMAWQRTSFALGVLAAIAIKLAMVNHKVIGMLVAIIALVSAGILYVFGRLRLDSEKGPFVLLVLCSFIVSLLGFVAVAQII